jgi:beta-lactamase regulating signal transducer with metallopeptidase domain
MHILVGIALKSLLIAGLTLGLLQLMSKRSAAERSWAAHVGLLALLIMAFAPLVLPSWNVEAPALFGHAPATTAAVQEPITSAVGDQAPLVPAATTVATTPPPVVAVSPTAIASAIYAVPAAILLLITFLALARLITLRARADVLVDGHWLSALARAQRRMGFKHGTALLTSNELASPISWGLMRPVILLNSRAVEATGEAEAIIAHELAHVARMDWIKLLLARVATALFWFNPLVWLLAREAHQLREEAADDSVLAADIVDTDYAQLLVGVARHECPGLLLGAHGVAPSKSSLARRVARVLDSSSVRGPAARSFALGVFAGALLVAAPLAALTLTPGGPKLAVASQSSTNRSASHYAHEMIAREVPADLPHIIAQGVSTSVATAVTAVSTANAEREAASRALAQANDAVARANDAAVQANTAAARIVVHANVDARVNDIVEMKALAITPEYVSAMRSVAPQLRSLQPAQFVALKSVGVDPLYVRDLADAGLRNLSQEQLIKAKSVGLSPNYVRGLAKAGIRPDIDDYVQLRTVGVPVDYVAHLGKSGRRPNADEIVELWAVGAKPEDFNFNFRFERPAPARSPSPPASSRTGRPAASPPDWKTPGG